LLYSTALGVQIFVVPTAWQSYVAKHFSVCLELNCDIDAEEIVVSLKAPD